MVAKRIFWAVCVALVAPSLAHALGLGDIRLTSALNQPLEAEIDLLNATPEELAGLKASLASRDTFARYGLDYPNFLSTVTLTRGKSASGRDVLKVSSAETMTEPFVSLLVEVNWGRGRLVREYTVLLDPPVFEPNTPRVADAPAPVVTSPSAGSIVRPTAAEPAPAAPGAGTTETYAVRRGDTLSGIAQRLAGASNTDQLMLGIYRSNSEAFEGSMNALRAGSVLRIPDSASVQAIPGGEAAAEVRRQFASWRSQSGAASGSGSGRLRLVAPSEAGAGSGGATAAEVKSLRDQLARLEGDLAQSKRLLELRNAELATLQKQLALAQAAAGTRVTTPAPAATAETPAPAPVEALPPAAAAGTETPAPAEAPVEALPPAAAAGTETPASAEAPVAEAPTAVTPPVEQPMRARVREAAAAESSGPSLLDTVTQTLSEYWYVLVGLLAVLAGLFGYRKFAEQRAGSDLDGQFAAQEMSQELPPPRAVEAASRRAAPAESRMVVEESTDRETGTFPRGEQDGISQTTTLPGSDSIELDPTATLSGDTGSNLDSSDPLAEADFHMAYGLYDQAADLVRNATVREPQRLDLKLKLVEVFFVWGNRNEFVRLAKNIHDSGEARGTGDWEKIVIMGRQIAPEEPMFSQAADSPGIAAAGVDLDLAGGDNRIDFDVAGEPKDEVVDLDLGAAPQATEQMLLDEELTQKAAVNSDIQPPRDNQGNTTRQMVPEFELPEAQTINRAMMDDGDAPTVEQPALRTGSPTIREKIDAAKRFTPAVEDVASTTAEVAIDDLGLDIGEIEGLDLPDDAGEPAAEAPTLVAGLDADSRRIMGAAAERQETGATATLAALDGASAINVDFEVGDKTLETPAIAGNGHGGTVVDHGFDLGSETAITKGPAIGDTMVADDLSLPPLEPVTMSEVGTKLDLARAYVDMGDPDGARNILQEVLQEGSMSQKQEAQRLLDSIPG